MVTDSSDVTHYGRVKHLTDSSDASGTAEINRSTVSMNSGDKLCIFNEQYNGDYMTDYASALEEVTIPSTINAYDVSTTLTNLTSNGEVYVKMREGYTATLTADSGYILPETIAVTVGSTPLAQGTDYTYDSTSGVLSIRADVISDPITIEAAGIAKSYSISADTESWDFGTVTEGYTQAPAAKTVTITNTGNQDVTVDLPTSTNYTVTAGAGFTSDKAALSPGSKAQFTVQPKTGLGAGDCSETLTISGSNSTSASVGLRFVVVRQSGGGSSGSSTPTIYAITVQETGHGTVTVSPKNAAKGKTVTITATPDAGCELSSLTVTDSRGNEIGLTDEGGGVYTFTMPGSRVSIKAAFAARQPEPEPLPFTDVVETAWYADAVRYVYENGLMNGVSATAFDPDGTMNRAMLVTILHRQAGGPSACAGMQFADVAAGEWYTEAVRWAAAEGIVTGVTETAFAPDAPITREQFATILYRYAQKTGADVSVGEDTNILSYADAMDISEYAVPAMQWACGAGVMQGSSGNLSPQGQATRAEAAAMLMRFCEGYAI